MDSDFCDPDDPECFWEGKLEVCGDESDPRLKALYDSAAAGAERPRRSYIVTCPRKDKPGCALNVTSGAAVRSAG